MENKTLIDQQKAQQSYNRCNKHLKKLENTFCELKQYYSFSLNARLPDKLIKNAQHLTFGDQIFIDFQNCKTTWEQSFLGRFYCIKGKVT